MTRKRTIHGALAVIGACSALVGTGSAGAFPDIYPQRPVDGSAATPAPGGEPYSALRTGIPDTVADYVAQAASREQRFEVVPYLSHGMLTPADIPAGFRTRGQPDAGQPHPRVGEAEAGGVDRRAEGLVAGALLAAVLLALVSTIALRDRRRLGNA